MNRFEVNELYENKICHKFYKCNLANDLQPDVLQHVAVPYFSVWHFNSHCQLNRSRFCHFRAVMWRRFLLLWLCHLNVSLAVNHIWNISISQINYYIEKFMRFCHLAPCVMAADANIHRKNGNAISQFNFSTLAKFIITFFPQFH